MNNYDPYHPNGYAGNWSQDPMQNPYGTCQANIPSIPPELINAAMNCVAGITHDIAQIAAVNASISDKQRTDDQRAIKEENRIIAGSHISVESGGTCIPVSNGRIARVWKHRIDKIILVLPDDEFAQKPFYVMEFSNDPPIMFDAELLNHPQKLATKLQELAGETFICYSGVSVATAMKNYIAGNKSDYPVKFYYGWETGCDSLSFHLYDGKTHRHVHHIFTANLLDDTPVNQITVCCGPGKLINTVLNGIAPRLRGVLAVCLISSLLFSVLRFWEQPMRKGFIFHCQGARSALLLKKILCVFGDAPISFTLKREDFRTAMTERKDQPMVFYGKDVSGANRSIIINDIWADSNMRAVPVILQEGSDFENYGSHFLCFEVSAADFDENLAENLNEDCWLGFVTGFTDFIAKYAAPCKDLLVAEVTHAQNNTDEDTVLALDDFSVIGLFKSLARIVAEYQKKNQSGSGALTDLFPEESLSRIVTALENCTDIADDDSMALVNFTQSFFDRLNCGEYCVRKPQDNSILTGNEEGLVVYTSKSNVYLPRRAMQELCDCIGMSVPSMCHILQEHGILSGAVVNKSTHLTRITVNRKPIHVYGLNLEIMEEYNYET